MQPRKQQTGKQHLQYDKQLRDQPLAFVAGGALEAKCSLDLSTLPGSARLGSSRPSKASLHSAAATVTILPLVIRHYGSITQKQKGIKHLSEAAYVTQQGKGHILAVGVLSGDLTSCLPPYPDR